MSDRNATIGFIGMGMMGGGMAANLLKAGFDMAAYDIDPAKNERFAGLGAKIANGPAGVAQAASTVFLIVVTTSQVRVVVRGEGGILECAV
ncbi:MAG: NAD(P)-binding domain-containing protein, partial [Rickettsiales bacterium]